MISLDIRLGHDEEKPYVRVEVIGFQHPEVAEPSGLDLLVCRVHASAAPVAAVFDVPMRVADLLELRAYLARDQFR